MSYKLENSLKVKRNYEKFHKSLQMRPVKSAYSDIRLQKNNQVEEVNIYIRKKKINCKIKKDRPLSHYINDKKVLKLLDQYHRQDIQKAKLSKTIKYKTLDERYMKDSNVQKKMKDLFFQQKTKDLEKKFMSKAYGFHLSNIYQNELDTKWQFHLGMSSPQFYPKIKKIQRKYKPLITSSNNKSYQKSNSKKKRHKKRKVKKTSQTFFINKPKNENILQEFKYRQRLAKKKLGIDYIQLRKVMEKNGVIYSPTLERIKQQAELTQQNHNIRRKKRRRAVGNGYM